jgi:integrase
MAYPHHVRRIAGSARRGEVGGLATESLDLDRGTVTIRQAIGQDRKGNRFLKPPKNDYSVRTLKLDADTVVIIRDHLAQQRVRPIRGALLFPGEGGGLLDLDAVSKEFAAIARRIGIKVKGISLHSFRHFGASEMMLAGVDVKTIAKVLGHRDETMVLRVYGHLLVDNRDRALSVIGDAIRDGQARRATGQK